VTIAVSESARQKIEAVGGSIQEKAAEAAEA
jgi:ribosomal protein L15